jgi:hypothetical protein
VIQRELRLSFVDTIRGGDWSTQDNFSFRVVKIEGWCRGFRASEVDEEEQQGTMEA